ncbi:MAG: ATP phosphoribosyltransferase regulatory subunit [Clostridiales Family XIII bacterium]|nr:ATP phosphoribosyltransferase regulatory subunit [Clostridiales Family XIII bacterium]
MTDNRNTLTPDGTNDRLFAELAAEKSVTGALASLFEAEGYRQVRTPGLEFLSVFETNAAYFPPEEMFKLSDNKGRLVAVRPDSTIAIARLTATKLKGAALPLRIYYAQSVYRRQPEHRGRDAEVMQMGVELIGEAGFEADVDMIDLAARSLSVSYAGRFRIEIGHVGLYNRLVERLGADGEAKERIHRYVTAKNFSALEDVLDGFRDRTTAALILKLPGLFGGAEALSEAEALFEGYDAEITEMLAYLGRVTEVLSARGRGVDVMLDLGLVNRAEYYSSLVFRGYGESAGEPLLSGGRYDGLFRDFGEDLPATGFGLNIDLLVEAAGEASVDPGSAPGMTEAAPGMTEAAGLPSRALRVALTKGRLEKDFMAVMEAAGYDMTPLRDKGRKLLIEVAGPAGTIEIFLAKAPDVVTYVEHGVCEIGIVGKDTLLEHGGTYYELMDLGLGKCRFALAALSGGPVAQGKSPEVIASKYPNYAGRYFERRGLDVRIIRIEGSVEIAPILGLADSIVDIVETGTTLKENGLEIVETIRDISARLIVNVTGMKLRKSAVEAFVTRIREARSIAPERSES